MTEEGAEMMVAGHEDSNRINCEELVCMVLSRRHSPCARSLRDCARSPQGFLGCLVTALFPACISWIMFAISKHTLALCALKQKHKQKKIPVGVTMQARRTPEISHCQGIMAWMPRCLHVPSPFIPLFNLAQCSSNFSVHNTTI